MNLKSYPLLNNFILKLTINNIVNNSFSTFILFIENMLNLLRDNNLSHIADEFETMQIEYPYTIRRYRGNISLSNNSENNQNDDLGNDVVTRNFQIDPSSVSPAESTFSEGIIQINLDNAPGPPLPRNLISMRIGDLELTSINLQNNTAEGFYIGLYEGTYDVTATFQTPNGTIFNYRSEQSFKKLSEN